MEMTDPRDLETHSLLCHTVPVKGDDDNKSKLELKGIYQTCNSCKLIGLLENF